MEVALRPSRDLRALSASNIYAEVWNQLTEALLGFFSPGVLPKVKFAHLPYSTSMSWAGPRYWPYWWKVTLTACADMIARARATIEVVENFMAWCDATAVW